MFLIPEWRAVLRYAWSFRLIVLAVVLSALAAVLPLLIDGAAPSVALSALAAAVTALAGAARVVAQERIRQAVQDAVPGPLGDALADTATDAFGSVMDRVQRASGAQQSRGMIDPSRRLPEAPGPRQGRL